MGGYNTELLKSEICLNSAILRTSMTVSLVVSVLTLNYLSSVPSTKTAKFLKLMNWINVILVAFNILHPVVLAGMCADVAPWILVVTLFVSLITAAIAVDFIRKDKAPSSTGKFLLVVNIFYLVVIVATLIGGMVSGKDLLAMISVERK